MMLCQNGMRRKATTCARAPVAVEARPPCPVFLTTCWSGGCLLAFVAPCRHTARVHARHAAVRLANAFGNTPLCIPRAKDKKAMGARVDFAGGGGGGGWGLFHSPCAAVCRSG